MRTAPLVYSLHRESIRARSGAGTVSLIAIISLTVGSACAFLVAGGTWMFWQRAHHPENAAPGLLDIFDGNQGGLYVWFFLAVIACAFILPALFSLTAQAAVLGASGRERRLATLRLLGLSSREVTRMTVVETGLQAVLGVVLGGLVSALLAPALTHLQFQDRRIELREILLPWWGYLVVAGVLLLLALAAAFVGMQRVRVSPLGVARRQMPRALKKWRLAFFAAVLAATIVAVSRLSLNDGTLATVMGLGMLLSTVLSINVVSPYILQLGANLAAVLPGTAHYVSCRRVAANSKGVWRRVAAMGFFGILAGFLVGAPLGSDGLTLAMREDPNIYAIFRDISTGALLTLGFGFVLTGMSIFLGQVAGVYEDAELHRSLDLMGVPRRFTSFSASLEVAGPVFVVSLFGFAVGCLLGLTMFASGAGADVDVASRVALALGVLAAGWLVTIASLVAVEPLRRRVLRSGQRKE